MAPGRAHDQEQRPPPGARAPGAARAGADQPGGVAVHRHPAGRLHARSEPVWLDAELFETEISSGLSLFAQGDTAAGANRLERGVALYRGDLFTENLYAEWALEERDRLRDLAGRGLRALVEIARSAGDLDTAAPHARRLAAMEPFDMDVQREFIEICMGRGRRSEAMRRYAMLRKRVKREFGQDPDFTLGDLRG